MTGSYVQSLLSGKVIEIRDKSAQAGAFLDAGVMKLSFIYPPTAEQQQEIGYQLWNLSDPVGGSRFIESYLNSNLVIAITGGAIDSESERGPALQLNTKSDDPWQLWQLSPTSDGYFFIQSVLNPNYVIDIREEQPEPGTIQVFKKKAKNTQNQLWREVPPYVDITLHAPPSLIGPAIIYLPGGRVQILPGNDPALGTTLVGNPFGLPNYPGGLGIGRTK